jgi:hypothetical protein
MWFKTLNIYMYFEHNTILYYIILFHFWYIILNHINLFRVIFCSMIFYYILMILYYICSISAYCKMIHDFIVCYITWNYVILFCFILFYVTIRVYTWALTIVNHNHYPLTNWGGHPSRGSWSSDRLTNLCAKLAQGDALLGGMLCWAVGETESLGRSHRSWRSYGADDLYGTHIP